MTAIHPASGRQRLAADPAQSTWLSANAGSGKTKVLTDRVARLLLSGTQPQRILCLTYTKAAAAEMQNRLFRRLGEWAMMDEARLHAALMDLGLSDRPDADTLAAARRLFARAIETPGGLKIQTIHSFCASLLRRFPLEAQVSPGFVEMDDRSAQMLRGEIVEDMAEHLAPDLVARMAAQYTGEDFLSIAAGIAGNRARYAATPRADLPLLLGAVPGDTIESLLGDVLDGSEAQWMPGLIAALTRGGANDGKAAARLACLDFRDPGLRELTELEGVLLTGATARAPFSAKIGSFPTKATRTGLDPDLLAALEDLMTRVEEARARRIGLTAWTRTEVLHDFAAVFLPEYERRKQLRGWLDFDDLILRARDLLSESSVAQWVLYRLDGGIDHILVDEAQDTGPEQWRVIELLAQEFTAGQGARDNPRTIFVVGDKKQSIYSFQGADLEKFDFMQTHFRERLGALGTGLNSLQLEYSFRSSPAVLQAVDATCAPFDSMGTVAHIAFRDAMPGRVDLWPVMEPEDEPEPGNWFDPVDLPAPRAPEVRLAETIAATIRDLLARGTMLPGHGGQARPMRAGDVLVLVQRRSRLFHEVIRACKAAGLPIAGADRLRLGDEIAVRDLIALMSFLATSEDDLSLATALRSPLFGWQEDDLFQVAHGRRGWLWERLRHRTDRPRTLAMLHDLRDKADYLRPFELIERILTRHGGRRRLLARLGTEAEDGIDQFLGQALAYERTEVPSLTGFLTWLETGDVEIKRQADAAGDRIRVMTVHGSKGLEAPVVIMPDTGDRSLRSRDETILIEGDVPVWRTPSGLSPEAIDLAREDAQRRWNEENQRLLYVAMTRAESWLIVAAAGKAEKDSSWHSAITEGLGKAGAVALDTPAGPGLRLACGDWPADRPPLDQPDRPAMAPDDHVPVLPEWARRHAPPVTRDPPPIRPSDLGGAKALPGASGLSEDEARARGTALHLMLERLPEHPRADWPGIARGLPGQTPEILHSAMRVLDDPGLRHVFAPDTLAEVPIVAQLDGRAMTGVLDRVIIAPDHVLVIDFKSNATLPRRPEDTPEGLLRQMGAYARAAEQIWTDRPVRTAILWTSGPSLMDLPRPLVDAALGRAEPA